MTLIEFIKSQVSEDTILGDLAEDVMNDKNFPYNGSEKEVISYLKSVLGRLDNSETFHELIEAYELQKNQPVDSGNLSVGYVPMKAEQWDYLKEHFPCDRIIATGEYGDIYRIYAVDSRGERAIKFDIYSRHNLTELSMVDVHDIFFGDLTKEITIEQALELLAVNTYEGTRKPTQPKYSEMIEFLQSRITRN